MHTYDIIKKATYFYEDFIEYYDLDRDGEGIYVFIHSNPFAYPGYNVHLNSERRDRPGMASEVFSKEDAVAIAGEIADMYGVKYCE